MEAQPKKRWGRAKGTPNKVNAKTREELWAYCQQQGVNPFQFLIDQVANPAVSKELRIQCAKEVAPYLLGKMKQVEVETGKQSIQEKEKHGICKTQIQVISIYSRCTKLRCDIV